MENLKSAESSKSSVHRVSLSQKGHKCTKKKGKTKSFNICAFGMGWWPNSAFVLNKNEVEHLPQLKCILGTQKITDFIPENGLL